MDWQRNDRLERQRRVRQYEHRREILRAIRYADAHPDTGPNGYAYYIAYANCDAMHRQMYSNAQASPDPGAQAIALT